MDGYFKSPVHEHLPNESINSHFRLVLPKNHNKNTPIVCILPATGDHSYFRRYQFLSKPLAKLGVGSALPVIPYYGIRKPKHQFRSYFLHASDMITLGAAIVTESHLLFSHLQKEYGFNKFGITGISMGGLMSAYSACLIDYPITLISFMSPISCYTYFKNNMVDLNALSVDTKHKIEDLINMTDLRNLPPPIGNTVFVGGYYDEYIHVCIFFFFFKLKLYKADEIRSLQEIWTQRNIKSNMEFKFLPIGHVMSVAYTSQVFTNIIHKSLFNTKSYNSFDQSWFDNHRMDPV